ncbi:MAG TPA: hypothetical protein VI669_02370, partial [Vicinamibacteria bacterium]
KAVRDHTVIAVDGEGVPLRVVCGFCDSQHNYRGGGEEPPRPRAPRPAGPGQRRTSGGAPFALVAERERTFETMTNDAGADLEMMLRRIIREESGLTPVAPADKWRGGHLVLRPANAALQEKTWPIETFFHKVVMLRNRLRTLEQQVNASDLPQEEKLRLQGYVTACYGTLTSFNVLFAEEDDRFQGASGE